ncbi:hypothetical protein NUW58_g8639 [Xylaria curta]|uniref:Uncharacterized protein n=1 Tax=Xylaria curta TaxID=42375 RepID=A0ACC1N688_9PEZI|nr:hypothetical protein NUW58_g8639 [Xylaria curta]
MGLLSTFFTGVIALAGAVSAVQYCDSGTSVCYSETKAGDLFVRVALPAVEQNPFDILMQVVAPKAAAGWAAIAWGGKMTKNPITVAWANGNKTVVSSRWADLIPHIFEPSSPRRCHPFWPNGCLLTWHQKHPRTSGRYPKATYTVLKGSTANATHWTLTALCSQCASWTADGVTTALNPNDKAAKFAYALAPTAPSQPANNASSIVKHTIHAAFTVDLAAARTDKFETFFEMELRWDLDETSGKK